MQHENPYSAPADPVSTVPATAAPDSNNWIWRDGNRLIMHRSAVLPDICAKSSEKTNGFRLKRRMSWHPSLLFITVLLSPFIYIILALILSKRATIYVPLSDAWRRKRTTRLLLGWVLLLVAGIAFIVGIGLLADERGGQANIGPIVLLGSLVTLIVSVVFFMLASRIVWPVKIDDHYLHLRGFHPDFLAQFEQVQPPPPVSARAYG